MGSQSPLIPGTQGRQLRLITGMQVNAEIHLGTLNVLEYPLSSVKKVTHEVPLSYWLKWWPEASRPKSNKMLALA